MDRMSTPDVSLRSALSHQISDVATSPIADVNGVMVDGDATRAAHLGELMKLPSLGEVLVAWSARIVADECLDFTVPFSRLAMELTGKLMGAQPGADLPLTYRTFGNLLRSWCHPPRNIARCLVELPVGDAHEVHTHSPRACAFNSYLERHNSAERARIDMTGEEPAQVVIRSRKLKVGEAQVRTAIAAVSTEHCLAGGDDGALISALALAFAGAAETSRASAWRGLEESEIRVLFPALTVQLPGDAEVWCGYVTAKNSETGAKSWSVSAGLYRKADGMTVACEALIKTGRHVGQKVPGRMVEVAEGAKELLAKLLAEGAELASKSSPWSNEETVRKMRGALAGTPAFDADVCMALAFDLGMRHGSADRRITVADLIAVLGVCAASFSRRVDSRPIEVLLGRVMLHGFGEFKAVEVEGIDTEEI